MIIKPLFNQILVKPVEKNQVLVSDRKSLYEYGIVVDIGGDVKNVIVGDKIGYVVWGIKDLEIDGEKHYFVPEDSRFLLCKLND